METLWEQPLFYVDDNSAVGFGRIAGTNKIGWALKRHKNWTAVYIAIAGNITPELIRAIVREAGVEPIGPNGDVTIAGNGIVAIHALSNGIKKLTFSDKRELVDLTSGETISATDTLSLPMKAGETRWFQQQKEKSR